MKKALFALAFIAIALSVVAQNDKIQLCKVRELNSKKKPIADAQVKFSDAPAAISDQGGNVRLVFQGRKPGEWTFFEEVYRKGYELVNSKEVEKIKLSADDQLGLDIILARINVVDSLKAIYYGVSNKSLKEGLEREKKQLKKERDAARLNADEYAQQLEQLNKSYEDQKKQLDELAEKFARVNFDDAEPVYQEALQLYKDGQVKAAIATLEAIDPAKRTAAIIQTQKKLDVREAELQADRAKLQKEKTQQIANLRLLADMYAATFDPAKAEAQYDQLLQLDTSDLEILQDAADFYRENHHYEKALYILPRIVAHPKAVDWQVANAYGYMGELYTTMGNLPSALEAFNRSFEIDEKLYLSEPKYNIYKFNMAVSYQNLGATYTALGNLPKSLTFFEQYNQLAKELHKAYPLNAEFKNTLAISYSKLGEAHTALGNLSMALTFFERDFELMKELHEVYPQNVGISNGLAISYETLGETHMNLGDLPKALTFFGQYNLLEKEMNKSYPQNVEFKDGLAISYQHLGITHNALGDLPKALTFFEQFNQLKKELHEAYPQNVEFKNGLAISYEKLGLTQRLLGNLPEALILYEQFNQLEKELHEDYPQNVEFKNGLAISYERLGFTHRLLGNLPKALTFFEHYNLLEKELYKDYPQNVDFANGLAISYQYLGVTHKEFGDLSKSLIFFEDETKLFEELHEANLDNVGFTNGLAISYQYLGIMHTAFGNLPKALMFFEYYNLLEKKLHEAYPQNAEFKKLLAISYAKLGETHMVLENLPNALAFYGQCNQLEKELYEAYPQNVEFKNGLASSYWQLGRFYWDQMKDAGKANLYFQKCCDIWKELSDQYLDYPEFKNNYARVKNILLELDHASNPIYQLNQRIQTEPDTLAQYKLYTELCDTLRRRTAHDRAQKSAFADALNGRAWTGFFLKKFAETEADVREGLALETENIYLPSNLAPALLLQGNRAEALKAYKKWMDKPFSKDYPTYREAFLDDLDTLEKAGVIPLERQEDVAAARALLKK